MSLRTQEKRLMRDPRAVRAQMGAHDDRSLAGLGVLVTSFCSGIPARWEV